MKYDLTIAHRVCPALSSSATGFTSKLEMVKATTASLASALHGLRVRLIVILDGCPNEYDAVFEGNFSCRSFSCPDGYEYLELAILRTPSIGNQGTWTRQIDELLSADDSEFIYFSEDDYLYAPTAFHAMIDFMRRNADVDFVTPLDHPDRYRTNVEETRRVMIRVSTFCHWREVSMTCLTFMMRQRDLARVRSAFDTYSRGNLDCTMWLGLTKDKVFDLPLLFKLVFRYCTGMTSGFGKMLPLAAWKWHGMALLTRRKYNMWGPLPTLAVHLSTTSLPLKADCYVAVPEIANEISKQMTAYLGIEDPRKEACPVASDKGDGV